MAKDQHVDINDFKLYAKTMGENKGNPTIVMDAGYGDDSSTWNSVITEIAKESQVLVYDRAGLGKSEGSPQPRTSRVMIKELNLLLQKSKIKPPYLLVGHSFGGVNAGLYATEYPNEVCGLLLIDTTPEDYRERFLPIMPKEFQQAYTQQFVVEGNYDEFIESLMQLKEARKRLNIPMVVISAGKKAHYSMQAQQLWHQMQRELCDFSTRSEFIIAENSAHYIQDDEPEVVIRAIKTMIEKIKRDN